MKTQRQSSIESPYEKEHFVDDKNPYFTFGKERKRPTHDAIYGKWEPVEPSTGYPAHRWDPISIEDVKEEMTTLGGKDEQSDTAANKGLVTETEKNEFCARKSRKLENLKHGKVKKRHSKNKSNKNKSKKADKVSE
ncbi:unnamed protein product [Oikopleura dioica]|uniref:Uncharacterized protein n=1 Tax=Oikopleura dioica TaxID=34765 RepID=E4XGG6_OIKDI|nr:unnamed protein product [Oikopleura dioica]